MAETESRVSDEDDRRIVSGEGTRGPRAQRAVRVVAAAVAALALVVTGVVVWVGAQEPPVRTASAGFSFPNPLDPPDGHVAVPGPDGLALPGTVSWDAFLPQGIEPLPDGIWEQDLTGWALGVYRTYYDVRLRGEKDATLGETPQVLVLGSPEGELYQVLELPSEFDVQLLRWSAGETTVDAALWEQGTLALVKREPVGNLPYSLGAPHYVTLDLATGDMTASPLQQLSGPFVQFVGYGADGAQVWVSNSDAVFEGHSLGRRMHLETIEVDATYRRLGTFDSDVPSRWVHISPDGTRLSFEPWNVLYGEDREITVIDLATGVHHELPPLRHPSVAADADLRGCSTVGWYDDDHLIRTCLSASLGSYIWLVDAATGAPGQLLYEYTDRKQSHQERRTQPIDVLASGLLVQHADIFGGGDLCIRPLMLRDGVMEDVPLSRVVDGKEILTNGSVITSSRDTVYFYPFTDCGRSYVPGSLERYDDATGTFTTMLPPVVPPSDEHFFSMQWNVHALNSVVVGD